MFAGPNGSGKSSLKTLLEPALQGVYVNPDELERGMLERNEVDFTEYGLKSVAGEALRFLQESDFLRRERLQIPWATMAVAGERLLLGRMEVDSYPASVLADFLRTKLLERRRTFTFETVMSHPGKVALLEQARRLGYRTYLYYVATEDPLINISRVENRVSLGGHPVPHDKIEERYHRSLDLLMSAIRHTHRAYLFDNSGEGTGQTWLAEITDGRELELRTDSIPAWFKRSVLDKIDPPPL